MITRKETGYRLAVDIGGTFTDIVLETPDGFESGKVLTTPERPEQGVIDGVKMVLDKAKVAASQLDLVIHGTTLATNAIIERRGARTALITTRGFRDTLEFAFGHRFDQYDLELERPEPLVSRPLRFEATERMAADGSILLALDEANVRELAKELAREKIESVAVCFINAYRNGVHEKRVRDILLEENAGLFVCLSHEVCPEIREYERTSTTVANAYVQPLMSTYLGKLSDCIDGARRRRAVADDHVIRLADLDRDRAAPAHPPRQIRPRRRRYSRARCRQGNRRARSVALDMGGTTAKIILLTDYEPRHARSMEVARAYRFLAGSGLPLRIPVIEMIEIGAGGGSIAHVDELGRVASVPKARAPCPAPPATDAAACAPRSPIQICCWAN